jgi:acyl-CoA thioesterase-1
MSLPKALVLLVIIVGAVVLVVVFQHHKTGGNPVKHTATAPGTIRYLPLGDSYTIGQSVAEQDRWPNQLAARYDAQGKPWQIVANPSVTGYTTQDLIDRELPLVSQLKPDFVTVLIGVNDYVQGVPAATFQKNLEYIVTSLQRDVSEPQNIVLVTIPDFGKTPTGAEFGSPAASEAGVEAFNAIIKQVAGSYKLAVADIFPVSQAVASDPSLIAADGLHPSAKEYTAWTDVIYQVLRANKLPRSR